MRHFRPLIAMLIALTATSCERRPDDVAVAVSVIGGMAAVRDPAKGPMGEPSRVMTAALAQGLVRYDAAGGIEPGLAERWIVTDGGRSYIFRLREASWADGTPVSAKQVVNRLKQVAGSRSRTPLAPFLAVIDEIVEMTPQVIEIRLKRPRPDLLKLFAQPELAIVRSGDLLGTGPLRRVEDTGGWHALRPAADPSRADTETDDPSPVETLRVRGERSASAIVRFAQRESDLVLGGSFRDWPLLAQTEIAPANIRIDPAAGLFGLAVVSRDGFLSTADNRRALAMAIDRTALIARFRPEWQGIETLLPTKLDSAVGPAAPQWQALPFGARQALARERVATWRAANPDGLLAIRIALPDGPGASLVWAHVARDLRAIGLQPYRVGMTDQAELRLIDAAAPYDSGRWYLVTACRTCPVELTELIDAARDAATLSERSARIAAADRAVSDDGAYIPIAQPLRWSLVAVRLQAWQENSRAWHPLNHLQRSPD